MLFCKFTKEERYAWLSGSFGLLLILLLSTALTLDNFVSHDKYVIVTTLIVVAPLLSYFFVKPWHRLAWLFRQVTAEILLFQNLLFILVGSLWFGAFTFGLALPAFDPKKLSIAYLGTLVVVLLVAFLRRGSITTSLDSRGISIGNYLLLLTTPVTLAAATILPYDWLATPYFVPFFNKTAAMWGTAILLLCLALWHLRVGEEIQCNKKLRWLIGMVVFTGPFLLMDPLLNYDTLHYTAYLGPATAVASGRIPLQEVFCQYGQSYLLYNLGFLFLPHTYHTAALVTTFSNALYLLCSVLILDKLIRNRLVFLILGLTLPFLFSMTYHFNWNLTPSHGGLRYLPVFLVATALVWMNSRKQFTVTSIASIFLAWAWSFEAAIYSTAIYAFFLIARAASDGATNLYEVARAASVSLGKLFAFFVFFVVMVCTIYLIATGGLPRYDLYVSLILSYVGTDPFFNYLTFKTNFYTWAPVLTGYFIAMNMIARQCFSPAANEKWTPNLAVVTALGLTVGVYCMLMTETGMFKPILLPFYLLLYWAFDAAACKRPYGCLITPSELGLAPLLLLLSYLLAGASVGNFTSKLVYASPSSTILRQILSFNRLLPKDFLNHLRSTCLPSESGGPEQGNTCSLLPFDEFHLLIERWQQKDASLLIFHPDDTAITVLFKKPHALPLSMAYVDGFSRKLFSYILARSRQIMINHLKESQTVIITKDLPTLNNLEWALLKELASIWVLEYVDETKNLTVYRLVKDPKTAVGPILTLPNRPVISRNTI